MGDTESRADLTDDEIASEARSVDLHARLMALEIQRRRAANRDLDVIKAGMMADIEATPEIKAALVREMATYRVMAAMGVRELRWNDADVTRLFERLSPAARDVYDRYIEAHAASEGFRARTGTLYRSRLGHTSKRVLEGMHEEIEIMRLYGELALEYERMVLPEIMALVEAKQRMFAVEKAAEDAAAAAAPPPVGGSGIGAEALRAASLARAPAASSEPLRTKITLTNISLHDSKESPSVEHIGPCVLKLGKASSNHITIADPDVARLHAAIEANHEGVVTICDMGSPFGTFVNGNPIRLQKLATGDVIAIGKSKYRITIAAIGRGP